MENVEERSIILNRSLGAPREMVFNAFIDPENITKWWGPNGFTTTTEVMSPIEGGTWEYTMHGPDGKDYGNKITYKEISKFDKLSYLHGGDEGDAEFQTEITFEDQGDQTNLTLKMIFSTKEARDKNIDKYGAVEGGKQTLNRLADYLLTNFSNGQ